MIRFITVVSPAQACVFFLGICVILSIEGYMTSHGRSPDYAASVIVVSLSTKSIKLDIERLHRQWHPSLFA
jgi:hypothetical protein